MAASVPSALAAGTLQVTPDTASFASVLVNKTAQGSVWVLNSGSEAVTVSDVTLTGSGSSAYTMDAAGCVGTTLEAGFDCMVYLTFTPPSVEEYPATVTVTSDAAGSPQYVELAGAGALPLPNDEATDAVTISSLPFDVTVDPFLATYSTSDPFCSYENPSLWYKFTPASDMYVGVTLTGAYAVTAVLTGSPGAFGSPECVNYMTPRIVALSGGTTYYFMLTTFQNASMSIEEVVPLAAPTVTVTKATVNRQGLVTVYGTVTCNTDAIGMAYVALTQTQGRSTVEGWGQSEQAACGTQPTPWTALAVSSTEVPFRAGKISVSGVYEAYSKWYGYVYSPTFEKVLAVRGTK